MPGRSNPDNRCDHCRMYQPLCLCAIIPQLKVDTKIMVFMHWRERKLTTNTATLACLALPNSEIHHRGLPEDPLPTKTLISQNANVALLYPTDDAQELTSELAATLPRPLTLIVPDGSWRQARKVSIREEALKNVPRLKISPGAPSTYRLRHSPFEENLSTFEAIARALGILEGPGIQQELEKLFLAMVERKLWSRGKLKATECITGIPQEAFDASRRAGEAGLARVARAKN